MKKLFVFVAMFFVAGFVALGVTGNIEAAGLAGLVFGFFFARYA